MSSSQTPAWVEDLNTIGDNVGGAESLISLDGDSLLETAQKRTGCEDFGGESWREPFSILMEAIRNEANLNLIGRILTGSEILRILENRLRIVDTMTRFPEISGGEIKAPIFITGTARSGTSILHELLAQDRQHRTPRAWEVLYSAPPPEVATRDSDPRIEKADREVTLWHEIAPDYKTMHENGGNLPVECIFLMQHEFASAHFSGVLDVPSYATWLFTNDLTSAFEFHKRQLQLLQWQSPGNWLLKAPSHLSVLPTLFSVYPDARIVLTHRDPMKTVASTVSLVSTLRQMRSDTVDPAPLARQYAEGIALGLEAVIAWRKSGVIPNDRIIDLSYADLMRKPVEAITGVYEKLGEEFTPETRQNIEAYLAAKPRGKHGRHRYALTDWGIEENWVRERYAHYMETYGVEQET